MRFRVLGFHPRIAWTKSWCSNPVRVLDAPPLRKPRWPSEATHHVSDSCKDVSAFQGPIRRSQAQGIRYWEWNPRVNIDPTSFEHPRELTCRQRLDRLCNRVDHR